MISRKKLSLFSVGCLWSVFLCAASRDYSLPEALKVFQAIERIQKESLFKDQQSVREIEITESELNSYIAYRIEKEQEQIMKELRLKLFEGNRIEGKMFIDLSRYRILLQLPLRMDLFFEGHLQLKAGKVRVKFRRLFLGKQSVPVVILDLIAYVSAQIDRTESSSFMDWYELPFGIKDIRTRPGSMVVYYWSHEKGTGVQKTAGWEKAVRDQ
ncbi:MAG: hypothetical protein WCC06_07500 [Candidatus Aminicenantales bacterium]